MKSRNINLIAAFACLVCAVAFTMTGKPPGAVVPLVFVGLANVGFVLVR
jgi:hypothetical protein